MKKNKSLFVITAMSIVAMLLTANLYADVYLYVRPLENSKKVLVQLSLPIKSTVTIYLFNDKGQLIYNEDIKEGSSYKRVFDLSDEETGEYTLISDSKFLKITKEISVNRNSIEVVSTEYLHRPVFNLRDDILNITYKNITQSDVKISIKNSDRIHYEGDMPGNTIFRKSFDLQELIPGKYKVIFEADGNRFVQYLTLS